MTLAALAAVLGALVVPHEYGWVLRTLASFDAGLLTLLCLDFVIIYGANANRLRHRAASLDPERTLLWVFVLTASVVSLFAAAFVLKRAQALAPESPGVAWALSLTAVIGAWLLTNVSFTLRYSHLYYRDDRSGEGGLQFPGEEAPDAWDFAYFAFTIGMCFQVSDVVISSKLIRRAVLAHSILSFAFNTIILGMALNLFLGFLARCGSDLGARPDEVILPPEMDPRRCEVAERTSSRSTIGAKSRALVARWD